MKGKKNDLPKDLSFSHSSYRAKWQLNYPLGFSLPGPFNSFLKQPRSSLEKHINFSKTNKSGRISIIKARKG